MFIEPALAIAFGVNFALTWEADDIDEKTMNTLKRAYNTHMDAVHKFEVQKQKADEAISKLINRKKAILHVRINQFLSVYQKIRKIDFRPGEGIIELCECQISTNSEDELKEMVMTSMKHLPERELVFTYLISPLGMGDVILKESKQNMEIANSQLQIANILSNQADLMVIAMDAISERAQQISALLAKFSVLFASYIGKTENIIQHNGTDRNNYSKQDRETLMTCVNIASSIKAILDVPILGEDGTVTEASLKALNEGECRLQKLKRL